MELFRVGVQSSASTLSSGVAGVTAIPSETHVAASVSVDAQQSTAIVSAGSEFTDIDAPLLPDSLALSMVPELKSEIITYYSPSSSP